MSRSEALSELFRVIGEAMIEFSEGNYDQLAVPAEEKPQGNWYLVCPNKKCECTVVVSKEKFDDSEFLRCDTCGMTASRGEFSRIT